MSSRSVVVRAWGSANAVPIATRSDRRANGSALVWSRISPSQPRPAALRMIAPTLAGLSTASSTTIRRQRAASSATLGRAGRWNSAMIDCGMPRPDTTRRTSSPPAYTGAPDAPSRAHDIGHPLGIDERGNGNAAGVERPIDDEVTFGEKQPGSGVVALVGAARQPAFVQPELGEPLVLGDRRRR